MPLCTSIMPQSLHIRIVTIIGDVWTIAAFLSSISISGVYGTQMLIFFFQAEDGIRDWSVTGVQTCALPICRDHAPACRLRRGAASPARDHDRDRGRGREDRIQRRHDDRAPARLHSCGRDRRARSEERRVGKECRARWSPYHEKKTRVEEGV